MTLEQSLRQIKRVHFWRERWLLFFLMIGFLFNLINWFYVLLSLREKGDIIPLHSSWLFGVDEIGPKIFLLRSPLVALAIFILNFVLAFLAYEKGKKFISQLLLVSSFLFQVLFLFGAIFMVKL